MKRNAWFGWAPGGALLAVGLALVPHSLERLRATRLTLERRAGEWAALESVRADLAGFQAARAAVEAVQADPLPVATLLARLLPDIKPDDIRDLSVELDSIWRLRRLEVSFAHAPVGRVMGFVAAAEQPVAEAAGHTRPGWRLARCTVRAAAGQPGFGQLALLLETPMRASAVEPPPPATNVSLSRQPVTAPPATVTNEPPAAGPPIPRPPENTSQSPEVQHSSETP